MMRTYMEIKITYKDITKEEKVIENVINVYMHYGYLIIYIEQNNEVVSLYIELIDIDHYEVKGFYK